MKQWIAFALLLALPSCELYPTETTVTAAGDVQSLTGAAAQGTHIIWLDHLSLRPGDPSVQVSTDAITSWVGGGLSALVIRSTTTGDTAPEGGNQTVHMAVGAPPGIQIIGVRLGYELTSPSSFVTQIRLAQISDPPKLALVILDDGTNHTETGPVFVDSARTLIDPERGPILLSLRTQFGSTADRIAIRGVGLIVRDKSR